MQLSFADIKSSFPRLAISQPGLLDGNSTLFVRRLIYGAGRRDQCLDDPTWEQIAAAILRLDGRGDVLLEGQAEYPYLVIGGGKDGNYLVAVGQKHTVHFLSDPHSQRQEPFAVVLGGQLSDYTADLSVSVETAMNAVWSFVKEGILLPSSHWVEEI